MAASRASVGIISIGSMGLGIAKLLQAHNYHVLTTVAGRSPATRKRAEAASIEILPDDVELVARSDYILSIVPPRDARATAERIVAAFNHPDHKRSDDGAPLYYLDLNAISPSTARGVASVLASQASAVRFIDGGIIGNPPALAGQEASSPSSWNRPSIPISGPYPLEDAPVDGSHLAAVLNTKYLGPSIGTASGLKACFASLTKGFYALAIQSYSTAEQLGVLPQLQEHLSASNPKAREMAERGMVGMPKKAYRWVAEMNEIGKTFEEDGGWGADARIFDNVAEVYRVVAEETELGAGEEKKDLDRVVEGLVEGLQKKS